MDLDLSSWFCCSSRRCRWRWCDSSIRRGRCRCGSSRCRRAGRRRRCDTVDSLAQIPEMFLKHLWLSEDQRFFQHEGFDWKEMDLAMEKAERTGKPVRGASTITNQCARSIFLWQGRSWIRKGLESYYTIWMELLLPKRRILELYANVIEMGRGIYGVEAASRHYFGVSARGLTREQSAMLAAVLPNPKGWDPTKPSVMLRWRQQRILRRERERDIFRRSLCAASDV